MAGAFRMAVSRARVDTSTGEVIKLATVTVRDGVARVKRGNQVVREMTAADVTREGKSRYVIVGADETWTVFKDCGCSGAR